LISGRNMIISAHHGRIGEPSVLRANIGDVDVEQAVVVVVAECGIHARAVGERAGRDADILECPVATVLEQRVAAVVVRHVDIGIAVAIVVAECHAEA